MASNGIQIGKVYEHTGLSIDAIQFYEKQRLLERPARSEGGFRLFTAEDVQRIQFIRGRPATGFFASRNSGAVFFTEGTRGLLPRA